MQGKPNATWTQALLYSKVYPTNKVKGHYVKGIALFKRNINRAACKSWMSFWLPDLFTIVYTTIYSSSTILLLVIVNFRVRWAKGPENY